MILGDECKGQSAESRERWGQVCKAILKQGELESANNPKISKAIAQFNDSHGEYYIEGAHRLGTSIVNCIYTC